MKSTKDQLKLHYEQQSTLIAEIKIMRDSLREQQKLTTHFRKLRDRKKLERQGLLEKTAPEMQSQDHSRNTLEMLKKRRDFLRREAKRTEGPVFKILSSDELEKLTIVELKYQLYELEFKQQTSSLSRDDEEVLVDEIRRIEERISLLEKKNEAIVADYLGDIPESKEKIEQEISEIEKQISQEEADRKLLSIKVQKMYDRIKPLKEEEDKAHQDFVSHLQKVEELKVNIEAKQEELDALKGKIINLKKLLSEETKKEAFSEIDDKIKLLLKKRDTGESLTPEEQEFLMAHGYVPF
ncbi:MAG: hypothetical protein EAX86_02770 [Candidatus Heimdallarchaeota archaeon]|nr:hypothetical protein [Candidatus Heimdallarchaeota archaeon]